ncbi:phage holin family protein [Saccharicrinis sp. FJH62]|uniref:phage holin family protein n=1 Tax=Saccharicrinis sp. FJH62 TaxID=3344657 RepID=UPI0035D4B69C
MQKESFKENISELNDIIQGYLQARINLWKVEMLEKFTRIGTYFITTILVLVSLLMFFMLISFAFSFWYGEVHGSISVGFLISGGVYLLIIILGYVFRRQIFSNPLVKHLSSIIFNPKDHDEK